MHLAVDLDGTLADIHGPAIQRSPELDAYRPNEFGQSEWDEYRHRSQNVWHNHSDEISPVEPCVPKVMQELADSHRITILTHRRNVDEQIRTWLDREGVPYDDLHPTARPKAEFDADAYIDDNPVEHAETVVILRSRPWNQGYTNGFDERVETLTAIPELLTSR